MFSFSARKKKIHVYMYQAKVQERHTFRKAQTAPNLWQNTLPAAMKFLTATCESKEGINDKIFACCLSALRNAICCFSSTKWVQSCTFRLSYTLLYLSSCSFPTFHKCERVRNELFLQILLKTKKACGWSKLCNGRTWKHTHLWSSIAPCFWIDDSVSF